MCSNNPMSVLLILVSSQLRHIENRLEAAPGTGVLLDSVLDTKKASVSGRRKISRRGETDIRSLVSGGLTVCVT